MRAKLRGWDPFLSCILIGHGAIWFAWEFAIADMMQYGALKGMWLPVMQLQE
jgi:hypothetical protein